VLVASAHSADGSGEAGTNHALRDGMKATGTRWVRWMRVLSLVWLTTSVLLAATALLLLYTDFGRRQLADAIEYAASDSIPGHMEIGRLTRVGFPTVVEDLRFFHPKGQEVLHVRHAEIDFNVADALLRGKLSFDRALAEGGRLLLSIDPDGRPSIEAALNFASHGPDTDPNGGLHYAMRNIRVKDLLLVMRFSEDSYRVRDVQGLVTIRREVTPGIRVELSGIAGRVEPDVASYRIRLDRVDGWVHGKSPHVLELRAATRVGDGGRMNARVSLFDREKTPVEVTLTPVEGVQSSILALLMYARGAFSSDLDIAVRDS
jgi:hypothetical protein